MCGGVDQYPQSGTGTPIISNVTTVKWMVCLSSFINILSKLPHDARVKSSCVYSKAYFAYYCYVKRVYIVQIGFFLSKQCSLVDNILSLSSWGQDREASAGTNPGASNLELSMLEAGL